MKSFSPIFSLLLLAIPAAADDHAHTLEHLNEFFAQAKVLDGPNLVDCTLSGGTKTQCFSITVKPEPTSYTPGPWCPRNINDDASKGGIWLEDGKVYDVNGTFVENLPDLYKDDGWKMYDQSTGDINVTETKPACEAAARPNVDPAYYNHCVECLPEYMPAESSMTYVIPLAPERTEQTNRIERSGSGLAYNGIRLDGPAPVADILSAYTIAPFDDCGGHVNTHVGYHYHAVTDCLSETVGQAGHPNQIGIAMDGYAIFNRPEAGETASNELDSCNGHETDGLGYHYHAGDPGSNAILGCLRAEAGCALQDPNDVCDASAKRRPRR